MGKEIEINVASSLDELVSLALSVMDVCREKKEIVIRKQHKAVRSALQPGVVFTYYYCGSLRKAVVRRVVRSKVYFEHLKRDGTVKKTYVQKITCRRGHRRKVKRVHVPSIDFGFPQSAMMKVASVRAKGEVVYRRSDFLRREGASMLHPHRHVQPAWLR